MAKFRKNKQNTKSAPEKLSEAQTPRERKSRTKQQRALRLVGEIVLVLVIVAGACAFAMRSEIDSALKEYNTVGKYKTLYNEVENYDYSKGRDRDFEYRIRRAIYADHPIEQVSYDSYAYGNYFYYLDYYDSAIEHYERALSLIPSDNTDDIDVILDRLNDCYDKTGKTGVYSYDNLYSDNPVTPEETTTEEGTNE